jgi:hypothetical protein
MIQIDFEKFHNHDYLEKGYDLYVLKNGLGDPLYIGISTQSIWERWFGWKIVQGFFCKLSHTFPCKIN